jgi:hypothetical protein
VLVCTVNQSLIHLGEGEDNLILLDIRNSLGEDDSSIQLQ